MDTIPEPKGKFVKVKCPDCGNDQTTFDRASTQVNCLVCGATLVKPQGGKASFKGEHKPVE
ncbi:MAG: 30S ribosomal protein S27e [Methanobacteriota archaeon]|nr:MAG: 30S ribosomal protein S27e [Euryarchaeota archaeon]